MVVSHIRKRNGTEERYDRTKIRDAVMNATRAVGRDESGIPRQITREVESYLGIFFTREQRPSVEQIQDLVEKILVEKGYADIAKAYILYREQRAKLRNTRTLLEDASSMIDSYLDRKDWKVKENSNMSYSLQGLNNYIASEVTGYYWLHQIYTPRVRDAHIAGDLHVHDLSNLSVYCCGWDLQDLLTTGFRGVPTKIGSGPPRHFRSALGQIVNFFYTLQGEAAGAQAFANVDTYLAPYIAADGLSYGEVRQAVQEFVFNLNVPTRVGFQTPFTNITMDLVVPGSLKNTPAYVGGEEYGLLGHYQREMDMFNRAFAEVMLDGDVDGKVFPFPIPTYNITREFDWDNQVLEPVWEMTAKYGIPYFANFVNSDMDPDDARSMCCRLRLDNRELRKRGGGLFGANPMTGSIGVVTVNLPRLGYLASTEEEFFARLDDLMDIARESLETKRKVLERLTDEELYPFSRFYLRSVRQSSGRYWNNHFGTIGINGMNEALRNFAGRDLGSSEGVAFAQRVMEHMRERMRRYQEETGNLYNLEATPAEGAAYRFARSDMEQFGDDIVFANSDEVREMGAPPYYTNSSHLPVGYTSDLFEALTLQDPLQELYTGGTVFHCFLGQRLPSGAAVRTLVSRIAAGFRLPYFTITPTFSICPIHGYIPGEHEFCPYCDQEAAREKSEALCASEA
ncbi:MAG: ribonucleoside triphosphate reductase [Synergistales bacterium]|nr:ribonucleoside triphosphate reductase [Synergistales bacterium]